LLAKFSGVIVWTCPLFVQGGADRLLF